MANFFFGLYVSLPVMVISRLRAVISEITVETPSRAVSLQHKRLKLNVYTGNIIIRGNASDHLGVDAQGGRSA